MMNNTPLYTINKVDEYPDRWVVKATLDSKIPFIQDHRVNNHLIVAGAYWLECLRSILQEVIPGNYQLFDLVWLAPLTISANSHSLVFLIQPLAETFEVTVLIVDKADENPLARAQFKTNTAQQSSKLKIVPLEQLKGQAKAVLSMDEIYSEFAAIGFDYGPSYRLIEQIWCAENWSLSRLLQSADHEEYVFDPGKVDAALQTCLGIAYANQSSDQAHLPFSIKFIKTYASMAQARYVYAVLNSSVKIGVSYHLFFLDEQGQIVIFMQDFMGRRPLAI